MIEIIFNNRDNPIAIKVKQDGKPLNFSQVTRMTCEFPGSNIVADSDQDNSLFDWSQSGGKIEFNFNDLNVPAGTYSTTLVAYDASHPDGQVLAHECGAKLEMKFVS